LSFRREHRLTDRPDFLRCYDGGRRFFSSCFVLFAARRENGCLPWRLGLAVTRKTGSAVRRNRVRRLIRECFRLADTQVPGGYDYVVVPKRGIDPRVLDLGRVRADLLPLLLSLAGKTDKAGPVRDDAPNRPARHTAKIRTHDIE
jgi:ribonuclease P protein component